ncbi:MAG: hypothetical protein K6U03_07465, partial [Firmicutes bacterium]|nr:hypothetical protein [Bacillota bacterium]
MSLLDREGFGRDLLLLAVVGIVLASLFSTGIAAATDKYFTRAVRGVIGDYGQYDLVFQVRTEFFAETQKQLERIVADRFPGSRLRPGLAIAGKSTIFLGLAPSHRTRQVFENLYYYFGNLPGNAGFSIIAEPRIVVSGVPAGAQDRLARELGSLPGVAFAFMEGDNLNLLLRSPGDMEAVRPAVRRILARYRLLEVRFPLETPLSDLERLGRQIELAVGRVPEVRLARDVTRGGQESDTQYMAATLSELRRFMAAYAARVMVEPAGKVRLAVGDHLVLQGRAPHPPSPGGVKDDRFVEIKLEKVADGVGEGLIVQGDASYITNPSVYKLLPEGKVGEYVGTATVVDESALLAEAIDEGAGLLQRLRTIASDPTWGETTHSLEQYRGLAEEIAGVGKMLAGLRDGLGTLTAAETKEKLRAVAAQIDAVSADLTRLAENVARVKVVEERLGAALDRVSVFQWFLRSRAAGYRGPEEDPNGLGSRLLAIDRGLTALGEGLRQRARQIDDFINRFNPFVQILLGWGERARVLADQLESFGGVLGPGSKGRQVFDSLLGATDATLKRLGALDLLALTEDASQIKEKLSFLAGADLDGLIAELERVRDSLPQLLDEEIGRSIGLIDRYLGGEAVPGQRLQIMINADADTKAVTRAVERVTGRGGANLLWGPIGVLEADFRGELFRVLAEVRTTITALVLLALFVLEFLFDQSMIVAMLHRRAEAVSRRVLGPRPRLARLGAVVLNPARLYSIGFGAFWLWACFGLTGARLPMMGNWSAAAIGGILGLFLGFLAERVNPIEEDDVMAGESLGLPFGRLMPEIV